MTKSLNNQSSNTKQLQQLLDNTESSVLASCYSVDALTSTIGGFHYCTTPGAGKIFFTISHSGIPEVPSGSESLSSPPHSVRISPRTENSWPSNNLSEFRGEAAYTIPEECERLFCDKLSAIFTGEMKLARQVSSGMDAYQIRSSQIELEQIRIQTWVEVWNYTGDAIYRGFLTDANNERTLFLFFGDDALGHNLKAGLIALFELASTPVFDCSQIVACIPRSREVAESDIVRNLSWCGFNLTTLKPWATKHRVEQCLSTMWLFLCAEV
ncbi:ornithine decarboxylase antizyme [Aspergillus clavatus NRRL 1]|uniref:Ornithine decarboxylase antizyme n=1 Tax=Aspergillus clavatus (strain ATCC 1007 / CBS 513.65 / DSM 816 / NCTC 3887 / NRRL 1 / QM 1276 / 107) TaxID=344612 RepID=A1C5W2_ASPCL|nr:ornithine decarboxylase antizyme, putative [Aspergillus clavatus NRRL 1]EAW13783.1 ornithine decarboxylase antizyme, putative [Aspergillus clavatus NRRL 1]